MMSKTLKIALDAPVKDKSEIVLREPTVQEILNSAREVGKNLTETGLMRGDIALFAKISGLDASDIEALPVSKFDAGMAFLRRFEQVREAPKEAPLPPFKSLILEKQIENDGLIYQELKLHEPSVKNRLAMKRRQGEDYTPEAFFEADETLLMEVSGWPMVVVRQMPISAFREAVAYLSAFFTSGQEIGEN